MGFVVPYKSLGGRNHRYSFNYGWVTSCRMNPVNVFGKQVTREQLGSGWLPQERFYSSIQVKFHNKNPFKIIFFNWICYIVNLNEFSKKFYEEILSDSIRFNEMHVICVK